MNPLQLLFYSFTRNKADLEKYLREDLEKKLRNSGVQRDASGKLILDKQSIERLQRDQSRSSNWLGLAIGSLFLVGSIAICRATFTTYHQAELLRQDGLTTTGVVIKKRCTNDSHNVPDYWVTYKFDANGQSITGVASVGGKTFSRLDLQGPVPIIFVRSDPSISFVKTSSTPDKDLPLSIAFTSIWTLFSGVIFYCSLTPLLKR